MVDKCPWPCMLKRWFILDFSPLVHCRCGASKQTDFSNDDDETLQRDEERSSILHEELNVMTWFMRF